MSDAAERLADPAFRALLKTRSRWRWGLSVGLVGCYLVYVLGGIYFPGVYAKLLGESSIPLGLALGYLLIAASVILSIGYVRVVNRLTGDAGGDG